MSGCTWVVALTASADWKRHRQLCFGHYGYHNPAAYAFYLRKSAALGKRGHGSDKVFVGGRPRASLLVWVDIPIQHSKHLIHGALAFQVLNLLCQIATSSLCGLCVVLIRGYRVILPA